MSHLAKNAIERKMNPPRARAMLLVWGLLRDVQNVKKFCADLAQNVVLNQLERRIFSSQSVTSSRKGFKNTIKSWWRKPRRIRVPVGTKIVASH